ncbi:hypothetical protein [Klebsiella sp. HMSC09D12]|uniref:hypothetical protein n=1 Tax=Klebsiella sp. HMSC09D12 TaxID=1581146 RepID=UPI0008A4C8A7|nr:hypothetical protein [Klebsiella sp. HMSC09D12]OFV49597.1 hypothetical protein HMPREF3178_15095 [Klebsiella sp. HMSC09D12]
MNNELTAAQATIEKCREITGCPDGVDLQDWVKQLAAENVGLKDCIVKHYPAVEHWNSWADAEDKIQSALDTPATDRIVAGIKADAAAPLVSALKVIANSEQHNGDTVVCDFDTLISVAAGALRDYYAKQLREGADK